jgi:archaellum component FlaC
MSKLIDLINPPDAFNEGYQSGLSDAGENKPKYIKQSVYTRYAFTLVNREEFLKSYQDGYNTGYTDGLRKKNQIFAIESNNENNSNHSNNLNSGNMGTRDVSLDYQIELLEKMKSYLNGFQERLGAVGQTYKNQADEFYEMKGLDDIYEHFYPNYVEVTLQKIQDLINQINEQDINYIENQISNLEETMERIKR